MKIDLRLTLAVVALPLLLGARGFADDFPSALAPSPSPAATPQAPAIASFTAVQALVLKPLCVSCHSGGKTAAGGYDFTTYQGLFTPILGTVPTVVPGNVPGSMLYGMAQGGHMSIPVSTRQLQLLGAWILQGAQNN